MIKKLTLALLLLAYIDCHADEVGVGFLSYHWDREKDYNERNPGIGWGRIGESSYSVYIYKNSHYRTAVLLTKRYNYSQRGRWAFDLDYGLVHGYEEELWDFEGITPVLLPRVSYDVGNVNIAALTFFDGVAITVNLEI